MQNYEKTSYDIVLVHNIKRYYDSGPAEIPSGRCHSVYVTEGLFLHFVDDGFESRGVVHGEVGEHLAVDLDTGGMDEAHELGV